MSASARETRQWMLETVKEAVSGVEWRNRVLYNDEQRTKVAGGIFTRSEMQNDNDQSVTRQIVVQIALPTQQRGPSWGSNDLNPQDALEDLATEVSDAVRVSNDLPSEAKPDGYWYARLARIDYGHDNKGQLTRAEITFSVRGQSEWA